MKLIDRLNASTSPKSAHSCNDVKQAIYEFNKDVIDAVADIGWL